MLQRSNARAWRLADGVGAAALRRRGLWHIVGAVAAGPRPAPDYTDVADRVGALGGTFRSARTERGAMLEAVLPCVS